MFRMAAISQPLDPRVSRNVVHIFRFSPPANPVSSYGPSASATLGVRNRILWIVILRWPPVDSELARAPRTTASRPLRHSPEETSWSASGVKTPATALESRCSRASRYLWIISRISDSAVEFEFPAETSTAGDRRRSWQSDTLRSV